MGTNEDIKIKVYFDTLGNQYIDKDTASFLGTIIDSDYYELSSEELDKLINSFDIEYELIDIIRSKENHLTSITIYFDEENNYLDKYTALQLGFKCDEDYLLLMENDARDLYTKYDVEYKLFEGKKDKVKENLILYVDEDNSIYIDKQFATLLGIKTDINYVELGMGTIEVAKKYYNVIFKDLYTKDILPVDSITKVEISNKLKKDFN